MLQRFDDRNADLRYWVNGTLRHRDEPGISPFDSAVQGGDAVWEGLRLYAEESSRWRSTWPGCAARPAPSASPPIPTDEEITAAVGHPSSQRHDRWRPHPTRRSPRCQGDQRYGPTPQPGWLHPHRPGRTQGSGIRHAGASAGHLERPRPGRRRPGPEDPPRQPAQLDPGQDRGEPRPARTTP